MSRAPIRLSHLRFRRAATASTTPVPSSERRALSGWPGLLLALAGGMAAALAHPPFGVLPGICGYGVILFALYQLFKDKGQSLGLAVTFTVPTALFGGTAPLVCSYLVRQFHNLSLPAFYVAAFCVIALPAAFSLTDSGRNF